MASDYDAIREENIKQYGEGTRHLEFLGRLYSDRTHFVYELLQNAEDKNAKKVRLNLYKDRLEFLHDGTPFDEADIRGICGVGEGTKSEDLTKIGKFGIGFKSVYAYTSSPRVHCGDENFRIENYVRSYQEETVQVSAPWTTKFVFLFNSQTISADAAFDEIAKRLTDLNVRTLLFLRSINEIEWKTDEGESGLYLRSTKRRKAARQVTIVGQHQNEKDIEETWLVFERPVDDPDGNPVKPVEIAYRIEERKRKGKGKGKGKIRKAEKIVRLNESPLFVFFATEKDTRLGFLLQGPYKTTPARDNIPKDDPWNTSLLEESAELVVDSLRHLKSMKLLGVSVLEAMPIVEDDFPHDNMFRKIYDVVSRRLIEEEFLPTETGGYISAADAKIGRGEDIRRLLSSNQLAEFSREMNFIRIGKPLKPQWLSGEITHERTPELRKYLIEHLNIEEITPEKFALHVTDEFFEKQPDEWFVGLYKFLLHQESLWRALGSGQWNVGGYMRRKPFVRLENNRQVKAFENNGDIAVYLPQKSAKGLPCIKKSLIEDNEAREFFIRLGVKEPDITSEVIERVLPLYEPDEIIISDEEHADHISLILQALKVDSMERRRILIDKLKDSYFLYARSATGEEACIKPGKVYSNNPDLEVYLKDNPDAWFLDERYSEKEVDAFLTLGVHDEIAIYKREPDRKGYVTVTAIHGCHERGLDGFDPGCRVDDLNFAVRNPNIQRSLFIWENIAHPLQRQFRGSVEKSRKKTYEGSEVEDTLSKIGVALLSNAWLPDKEGEFHKPGELSLDALPSEFERYEDLASHLRMIGSELSDLAQKAGFDVGELDLLRELKSSMPEEFKRIKELLTEKKAKPAFPERMSSDPKRRAHRARVRADEAPKRKYEVRPRSVKTSNSAGSKDVYLRESYTRERKLFCQICEDVMPFRGRDNEYYLESVQVLDDIDIEHEAKHLALCPLCAAKFTELVKKDEKQHRRLRHDLVQLDIANSKDFRINIRLGNESGSIRFVETHLIDIKELLDAEDKSPDV